MKPLHSVIGACTVVLLLCVSGCGGRTIEDRAREAEEQVKGSFGPDFEALAIAQNIDPAVAREVQENLTAIHEYQGEVNGKFDSVTVNAIQAFQRTIGVKDTGIVDDRTRNKLQTAGAEAKQRDSGAKPAG